MFESAGTREQSRCQGAGFSIWEGEGLRLGEQPYQRKGLKSLGRVQGLAAQQELGRVMVVVGSQVGGDSSEGGEEKVQL